MGINPKFWEIKQTIYMLKNYVRTIHVLSLFLGVFIIALYSKNGMTSFFTCIFQKFYTSSNVICEILRIL